jgi:hypothetical protein
MFVVATLGCGISQAQNIQINAARTKSTQKQNDEITNTFSKYCEVSKDSRSIHKLYKVHTTNGRKEKLLHI